VLSGRAIENIEKSVLDELVVTNTIPLSAAAQACAVSVNWISHR
jgi:ribose-phosphate pyrophosphokinase